MEAGGKRYTAMRDEQSQPSGKASSRDISPVLRGWDYEPGAINVRKVTGIDGSPKLQMRLDLGLLQMELEGRPDGVRPHGCESLLEFYETRLKAHRDKHGTSLGFHLDGTQCQQLREEAAMYYHRYLSLFVLEDFAGVVRDTARNLRVLDFCGEFAEEEQDRLVLEQYRPYITMMNARAAASILFKEEDYAGAMSTVKEGLENIRAFFERFGQSSAFDKSTEVRALKRMAREIRRKLPVNPVDRLRRRLERAIKAERYEEAAKLRDKIAILDNKGGAESNTAKK